MSSFWPIRSTAFTGQMRKQLPQWMQWERWITRGERIADTALGAGIAAALAADAFFRVDLVPGFMGGLTAKGKALPEGREL